MYTNPTFYKYQWRGIPVAGIDINDRADDIVGELSRNGAYCPAVAHVTTEVKTTDRRDKLSPTGAPLHDKNGNTIRETYTLETPVYTTIVEFEDGTKCVMKCSKHDKPDTETAIVNAIAKRIFGKVDPKTGVIDGNGFGLYMKKLAKSAFNREENEKAKEAQKAKNRAEHEARTSAEHAKAQARKAKRVAEDVKVIVEALKSLGYVVPTPVAQPKENKCKILNETCDTCPENKNPCSYKEEATQEYVRPDKKFSEFTQEEKRAYWRAQKRGAL